MTTPDVPSDTTCNQCGASIDESKDVGGVRTPCAACGSTARKTPMRAGPGQFAPYALDNYFAPKLSALTECQAPELEVDAWLNNFILTTIFQVRLPMKQRAYAFNFIRRAEAASAAYRAARTALIEYVQAPPNVISPYFTALVQFEMCIAQCYQGFELVAKAAGVQPFELFAGGKAAPISRLHSFYIDSKHMDEMILGDKLPDTATVGVWLTNTGIESARSHLSFEELHEALIDMHGVADVFVRGGK